MNEIGTELEKVGSEIEIASPSLRSLAILSSFSQVSLHLLVFPTRLHSPLSQVWWETKCATSLKTRLAWNSPTADVLSGSFGCNTFTVTRQGVSDMSTIKFNPEMKDFSFHSKYAHTKIYCTISTTEHCNNKINLLLFSVAMYRVAEWSWLDNHTNFSRPNVLTLLTKILVTIYVN